jgi:hypothetical protein
VAPVLSLAPPLARELEPVLELALVREWIQAQVVDSGPGFAPDFVRRLALPFARPVLAHRALLPEP